MNILEELKTLDIEIDPASPVPVYEQVKQGIKLAIISGHLQKDDRLPPIRDLASKLKINSNTIVKVYYQLDVEGFVYSRPGSGYFVRGDIQSREKEKSDLFKNITGEYISKALKLGFSLEDMIRQLQDKNKAKH